MNTTQKGNIFEHKVFSIFSQLLENSNLKIQLEKENELHIIPKSSIIGEKVKKYFEWGDAVINDLAIEDDNLLVLIECKSYGSSIDRGDILEFAMRAKLLKATKGIFVTSSNFQSGAINVAKACNIALVRIKEEDGIIWDLYRIGSSFRKQTNLDDFLNESLNKPSVIVDGNRYFESLPDYLGYCLNIVPPHIRYKLPYWSEKQIEMKVVEFVNGRKYNVMTNELISFYAIKNGIQIETNYDCGECLGMYNFIERKIYISDLLEEDELLYRKRFTIAHELGHAILHHQALKEVIKMAQDKSFEDFTNSPDWMRSLEIQANIFASYLLIPRITFINVTMEVKSKLGIPTDKPFYLDRQECNQRICNLAITTLSLFFKVSKWAIKIRLKKEHFLIEKDQSSNPMKDLL